jgi:hypothetical protein
MSDAELARRRSLLFAALGFALVDTQGKPAPKEIQLVREWLDNWKGLGHVVVGMERQGHRLHLTNAEAGIWRATFARHPMTSAEGFGAAATPWGAMQEAAWSALKDGPLPRVAYRRLTR